MKVVHAIIILVTVLIHPGTIFAADLKLDEIMPGPASDWDGNGTFSTRDDEWVEVVNAGSGSVALDAFFLTDGDGLPRFAFTGSLAAGARVVVYGGDAYAWERANGQPAFGLSLGNSGDAVMLWQVAASETLLVDTYAYGSHEAAADRAVGRLPDATGAWVLFDGMNPYTGAADPQGNGCNPTPGAPNTCESTPARVSTWGRLKTLYR